MGGIEYVYRDGARLTPWMNYCMGLLDADLQRLFGVRLALAPDKGIRTLEEQTAIFLSRYRVQLVGSGPFGDVRWWKGRRYVRHSGLGTVAQPGTSNHEIQGSTAAVDVADSGGAGIGTMGSARSNWLRANASRYGLVPEGFGFGEAWHYAIPHIFNAVPGTPAGGAGSSKPGTPVAPEEVPEEDEMKETYIWWLDGAGKQQNLIYAVGGSGFGEQWESNDGTYNTGVAKAHNLAGPSAKVSAGHAQNVLNMLAKQRIGS